MLTNEALLEAYNNRPATNADVHFSPLLIESLRRVEAAVLASHERRLQRLRLIATAAHDICIERDWDMGAPDGATHALVDAIDDALAHGDFERPPVTVTP